jgi:hypothetical protein
LRRKWRKDPPPRLVVGSRRNRRNPGCCYHRSSRNGTKNLRGSSPPPHSLQLPLAAHIERVGTAGPTAHGRPQHPFAPFRPPMAISLRSGGNPGCARSDLLWGCKLSKPSVASGRLIDVDACPGCHNTGCSRGGERARRKSWCPGLVGSGSGRCVGLHFCPEPTPQGAMGCHGACDYQAPESLVLVFYACKSRPLLLKRIRALL